MNVRSLVPVSAIAIVCLGVASGTAQGAPAAAPVEYSTTVVGDTVVTTLDAGIFELSDDGTYIAVEDAGGNLVTSLPLSMTYAGVQYPVAQQIADGGTTLSLTPLGLSRHQVATVEENDIATRAFNRLFYSPQSGIGAGIGGTLFAIVGGLLGAVAGCAVGLLTVVGAPLACPIGAVAGAIALGGAAGFAGAFVGVAIAGGQPLYQAWEDMYYTVTGAPWTSKFYDNPNNGLQQNTPIPVTPQ